MISVLMALVGIPRLLPFGTNIPKKICLFSFLFGICHDNA